MSVNDTAVSIAIVVGVRIYREGLAAILAHDYSLHVVGSARNVGEARALFSRSRPTVVLVDVGLDGACALTQELAQSDPSPAVLALGASESDVIRFAETGATGFVTAEDGLEELIRIARGALRDELCCSPRIAHMLLRRVGRLSSGSAKPGPMVDDMESLLTARQKEVVQLMAFALSNKEIAARLSIEESTVKNHVHTILDKLKLRRREEVIVRLRRRRSPA